MSVAGTDSGGGAGIQADLKTMTVLGAFGTSVVAALTAQNGAEVRGIHEVPVDFLLLQLAAVREGFPVKAAKTGMLASVPLIEALADALADKNFPLVVDPVCVSQSGYRLLHVEAEEAVRRRMLPLADVLTPNKPEAELLSGVEISDHTSLCTAADKLHALGAQAVLIKGGHFENQAQTDEMTDWLCLPGQPPKALIHPRVNTVNNHGTGCTLSAAIAVYLAFGCDLEQAVRLAQSFLSRALASSFNPGIGAGPPNFLGGSRGLSGI
ncbi:bifunctional hydroxymethylpyrimidine kinase/phosphomethylpyrimidine kinase [Desulfovibrio sp. OttesenSCG-928-G15]|nr:bifunctional hydroxymethylpyrimidine kinase/phosphomethylpyrimidine kinase [Desulfovibrio sp. OttesenSCG-928-G15]